MTIRNTTRTLSAEQAASFVADGFLWLDGIVPNEVNIAAYEEMTTGVPPLETESAFDDLWLDSPGLGAMIRLPEVAGAVTSLLGGDVLFDYHAVHFVEPGAGFEADDLSFIGHKWHSDAYADLHPYERFQINLFYVPHDQPREMGGTMLLPGSHFRKVDEAARYQNIRGQRPLVCAAGTVILAHHALWHCAQPNLTSHRRCLLKLVLLPSRDQFGILSGAESDSPEVREALARDHGWEGNELGLEWIHRIQLWRQLTGDASFDLHSVMRRYA